MIESVAVEQPHRGHGLSLCTIGRAIRLVEDISLCEDDDTTLVCFLRPGGAASAWKPEWPRSATIDGAQALDTADGTIWNWSDDVPQESRETILAEIQAMRQFTLASASKLSAYFGLMGFEQWDKHSDCLFFCPSIYEDVWHRLSQCRAVVEGHAERLSNEQDARHGRLTKRRDMETRRQLARDQAVSQHGEL